MITLMRIRLCFAVGIISNALLLAQTTLRPTPVEGSWVSGTLQIILQLAALSTILFGVVKVINRNEEEWRQRELRLLAMERELANVREIAPQLATLTTQMAEIAKEMGRVRDRLDRFLDIQAKG